MKSIVEIFNTSNEREAFEKELKKLAMNNNGKIPFTHTTSEENWESIKKSGLRAYSGTDYGFGTFAIIGHVEKSESDYGPVRIYIDIPMSELDNIKPDENVYQHSYEDSPDYDEFLPYKDLFRDAGASIEGEQVVIEMDVIPTSMFKRVQ